MSRLPTPGGDGDIWGDILNDFLAVEHNSDGSLKKAGAINGAEQTSRKGQAGGYAPLDGAGQVPAGNIPAIGDANISAISQSKVTNLTTDLAAKTDKATLTAKGDMYVATAPSAPTRFGVGTDGGILTADSSQPSGLRWGTHVVGGGNYITNPSFVDGLTGWTAGAGGTLSINNLSGLYDTNCGSVSRSSSTGTVSVVSPRSAVLPSLAYSASGSFRLGTLGTSTARLVNLQVNWYDAVNTFISSQTSATVSESIQGTWATISLPNAIAPDNAAKAEVQVNVAGVPTGEAHYFDGFQLEPGSLPTSFNANFPQSSFNGNMMAPLSVTSRETAVGSAKPLFGTTASLPSAGTAGRLYWATDTNGLYFDNGTSWTLINASGSASLNGPYDFPFTYDPRFVFTTATTNGFTANNVYYFRLQGSATINGLLLKLLATANGQTLNLALYTNTGSGRSAKPNTKIAGSDLSITLPASATDISANFGSPIAVSHGMWVGFSCTSVTAAFYRTAGSNDSSGQSDGLAWVTTTSGTGPTLPASAPALSSFRMTPLIVGI